MTTINFTCDLNPESLTETGNMLISMGRALSPSGTEAAKPENVVQLAPAPVAETVAPAPVAETVAPAPVAETVAPAPVAETVAPAPVAETAATLAPLDPAEELDADGLPWDARINASSKKKLVKEKTWKLIRGVDPTLVETVRAELRARIAAAPALVAETIAPAPAPTPADTAPPPPVTETIAPAPAPVVKYLYNGVAYTEEQLHAGGWDAAGIAGLEVAPADPAPVATSINFPSLMAKITAAQVAGTLTEERLAQVITGKGLASLPMLAASPGMIGEVDAELFPA